MADKHKGSGLDDFLREEGALEELQTRAVKEVRAWKRTEKRR